jgi:hypothetical protein
LVNSANGRQEICRICHGVCRLHRPLCNACHYIFVISSFQVRFLCLIIENFQSLGVVGLDSPNRLATLWVASGPAGRHYSRDLGGFPGDAACHVHLALEVESKPATFFV